MVAVAVVVFALLILVVAISETSFCIKTKGLLEIKQARMVKYVSCFMNRLWEGRLSDFPAASDIRIWDVLIYRTITALENTHL